MSVIYSEIHLFDGDQSIYRVDDNGEMHLIAKAPLESLADVITEQCYEKGIYNVKLFGTLKELGTNIQRKIQMTENTKFNANKIMVEVH